MIFAEGSAALKALFRDEPNKDKPCPTRNYFAEKPASLLSFPVVYERSFPRLPSGAPIGCAHVIDVSIYQNKTRPSIRVADLVVTFLFNYSLDLLYAFLNVTRHPEFVLTRIEVAGRECRNFSIERSDLTVTVSDVSLIASVGIDPWRQTMGSRKALLIKFDSAHYMSENTPRKQHLLRKNSMTKKLSSSDLVQQTTRRYSSFAK